MFVFDSFLMAILSIVLLLIEIYTWIIIISALISWVNPDPYNPIVRILYTLAAPAYRLFARFPLRFGAVDLTPLVIILALQFLKYLIINLSRGLI